MTYRERRLAKAERLRGWATKREETADAAYKTAHAIGDQIPFGQPILVGHHSERGMRRDISRIDSNMRKSVESSRKAIEMQSRADNIEAAAKHAIYADDEDAIARLEKRVTNLEARREELKGINAKARKAGLDEGQLSREMIEAIDSWRRHSSGTVTKPVPSWVLTNLSGNINRNKKRLESLKRKAGAAA